MKIFFYQEDGGRLDFNMREYLDYSAKLLMQKCCCKILFSIRNFQNRIFNEIQDLNL